MTRPEPYKTFMQSRFIGIFDSGVGGLAVYRAARELLPNEAFVYVADSGFAPYGDREPGYIASRVIEITDALVKSGALALVIACNTATVTTISELRAKHALPIIGIEPAIKPATALSVTGKIVVLTTQRTAESDAVARLCQLYGNDSHIVLQACPGLADYVEAGEVDSIEVNEMLKQYLATAIAISADVIVLGCTHFTFLTAQIQRLVGPDVTIIEPSTAVAQQLARQLTLASPYLNHAACATELFYTTATSSSTVSAVMSKLLERPIDVLTANHLGLVCR